MLHSEGIRKLPEKYVWAANRHAGEIFDMRMNSNGTINY
jgi:hypothetical protein